MKIIILLSCFFCLQVVSANVLIFNFNNNSSTVQEVETWAQADGLQVYTYPNDQVTELTLETVPQVLSEMSKKHIEWIVFSGHSGSEKFSGANGYLHRKDLLRLLEEASELKHTVKYIIARGCYTATIGDFLGPNAWSKLFPSLEYVAGYDGKAWSSEKPESVHFMRYFLTSKSDLSKASDEDIIEVLQDFEYIDRSEIAVWIKSGENIKYYSTQRLINDMDVFDYGQILTECKVTIGKTAINDSVVGKYFKGEDEGFLRPPTDYQYGSLRPVYTWASRNKHCRLYLENSNRNNDPDFIASLLFYDNLVENYNLNINMDEFNSLLDWLNQLTGLSLEIPNLYEASRKEIRAFSRQLEGVLTNANIFPRLKTQKDTLKFETINYYSQSFRKLIAELEVGAIPFRWLSEKRVIVYPFAMGLKPQRSSFEFIQKFKAQ